MESPKEGATLLTTIIILSDFGHIKNGISYSTLDSKTKMKKIIKPYRLLYLTTFIAAGRAYILMLWNI